jgi:hypothetical protein
MQIIKILYDHIKNLMQSIILGNNGKLKFDYAINFDLTDIFFPLC